MNREHSLFERVKERLVTSLFSHSHDQGVTLGIMNRGSTSSNQETIKALCDILEEELLLGKNEFLKEDEMNIK